MATLADLKRMLLRLLADEETAGSDPIAGKQYDASLLQDGICAGMDAILPWVSQSKVATLTGDGTTTEFALPADLYRIEAVYDEQTARFIRPLLFHPDAIWGGGSAEQLWVEYPEGYLTLLPELSTAGAQVYYAAPWLKPALDIDTISAPEITHVGVLLYGASYCLLNKATASANIRQYNTKVDSGSPVQNSMLEMSMHYLKRFETEMNRHPVRMKGVR